MADFDVAIIGGGINGCGIARDAAGRGLSVFLAEQSDLASGTSSYSSKLIHGGLRYLEHYAFRLVRESLHERERLLHNAPHLVSPLRFVVPHAEGTRPAWMVRTGLKLYDWLAGRSVLPKSASLDVMHDRAVAPLRNPGRAVFSYYDCFAEDARLVVTNAISARELNADIRTRTKVVSAKRAGRRWEIVLAAGATRETVTARTLVNAAGPWAGNVLSDVIVPSAPIAMRLVKGSHIVVPRIHDLEDAYLLQNDDGREVFVIPFANRTTLIGTTDIDVEGDPAAVSASPEEVRYLCRVVERFFEAAIDPSQVIWSFAGVRPLIDDGSGSAASASRDYRLEVDEAEGTLPLLSLIGGKLTAYRSMSETVVDRLGKWLPLRPAWTARALLPGGDLGERGMDGLLADLAVRYPFLAEDHRLRLARAYGSRAVRVLGDASSLEALGPAVAGNLHQREIDYLREQEWAMTADDILWRRSKIGLVASAEEVFRLDAAMNRRAA
jgi:glycerol-3-phosphate dehydrogenase